MTATSTARPPRRRRPPAPAPGPDLLADLADSWATALTAERKAPNTISLYTTAIARFIAWHAAQQQGGDPRPAVAADLDRPAAAAVLADLLDAGAAPATARTRYSALRLCSRWLAEEGATDADLLLGLRPPKEDDPVVDGLTDAELAGMIKACKPPAGADSWTVFECLRDEAVIRLLADTGARAGECIGLRADDVDLKRMIVTIVRAKGGKHRISAFSPQTARALDRYLRKGRRIHRLAHTPPLWLGSDNRGWSYPALRSSLLKRAEAAGVKGMRPHRLRHTSASRALDAGVSEGDVMASHGWQSRAMLDRYVKTTAQDRAAASMARYFAERDR
jgi:integrase